jgi:hypothetical protein
MLTITTDRHKRKFRDDTFKLPPREREWNRTCFGWKDNWVGAIRHRRYLLKNRNITIETPSSSSIMQDVAQPTSIVQILRHCNSPLSTYRSVGLGMTTAPQARS